MNQLLDFSVDIAICDFKAGGDWDNIVSAYAEYTDCDVLLRQFYDSFVDTIHSKGHVVYCAYVKKNVFCKSGYS